MSTRWRVVDLVGYAGVVSAKRGRVCAGDNEVPLAEVGCILLGSDTQLGRGVVALAAKYDVPLVTCDWRGVPIAATSSWSENSRVGARHRAQADMSLPRRKNAWMRIVQGKVRGQAANLPAGPQRERLLKLVKAVRSGDPDNVEAQAARIYWSRIFVGERFTRDRNMPGRNAHLNYGYAVLRGMVVRSICAAGLSPTLSVFHRHRGNAFALADDLIEPFRPAVDFVVRSVPGEAQLEDRAVKAAIVDVLKMPMGSTGTTVMAAMTDLAQAFALYAEGQHDRLTVPVWTTSG